MSENENHVASSWYDKGPMMDWTDNEGLYRRFKVWKQRVELIFAGPLVKVEEEIKCKYLLLWAGERGLDIFNSWALDTDQCKELKNYFDKYEEYVRPQSNELIAGWELHCLKQGTLSLEEFITRVRTLVIEAGYPSKERFVRDHLVFGMNSDRIRKECLKIGNNLTLDQVIKLSKTEESATRQMKRMTLSSEAEVNPIMRKPSSKKNSTSKQKKCQNCLLEHFQGAECPAKKSKCFICRQVGHYSRACKKKRKKKLTKLSLTKNRLMRMNLTCIWDIYRLTALIQSVMPIQCGK